MSKNIEPAPKPTPAEIASQKPREPKPKNLPFVEPEKESTNRVRGYVPKDEEFSGLYKKEDDGLPGSNLMYALCVVKEEDAVDGKTHFLKNTEFFWNGTKSEFKMLFQKS